MTRDRSPTVGRRRVLGATAGVATLGGCLGGDGNGGGGDDGAAADGTTTTTPPAAVSCRSLTDGYARHDPGAEPMVATLEYPTVLGDLRLQTVGGVTAQGRRPIEGTEDEALVMQYVQLLEGDPSPGNLMTPTEGEERPVDVTIDFGGVETPVVSQPTSPPYTAAIWTSLPYEVGGETLYFFTEINVGKANASGVSDGCMNAMVTAVRHVATSLAPNPDSTIAEEMA